MAITEAHLCPGCKKRFPKILAAPQVAACPQCGVVTALRPGESPVVEPNFKARLTNFSPGWLKPGESLDYKGKIYTIYSAALYHSHWNEWDNEDNRWGQGFSENTEWTAIAKDGSRLCIELDDRKHFVRETVKPNAAQIQLVKNTSVELGIVEYGTFQLGAFIGENGEALDRRLFQYKVLLDSPGDLVAEWQADELEKTLECVRYVPLTRTKLEHMRVRDPEEKQVAREQAAHFSFLKNVFGFGSILFFILWLTSFSSGLDKGQPYTIPFSLSRNTSDSLTRPSPHTAGVFRLEKGKPYRLVTICSFIGSNADADFAIEIYKTPEGTSQGALEASFWVESGVDDEGAWTESELSDEYFFRADESGEHEVIVRPLTGNGQGGLTVSIRDLAVSRYYFIGLLLFTLLWLRYQWLWESVIVKTGQKIYPILQSLFGQ